MVRIINKSCLCIAIACCTFLCICSCGENDDFDEDEFESNEISEITNKDSCLTYTELIGSWIITNVKGDYLSHMLQSQTIWYFDEDYTCGTYFTGKGRYMFKSGNIYVYTEDNVMLFTLKPVSKTEDTVVLQLDSNPEFAPGYAGIITLQRYSDDSAYGVINANFCYNNVNSIARLYYACNAADKWCKIEKDDNKWVFTSLSGISTANIMVADVYNGLNMGIQDGFIVGMMYVQNYEYLTVVCYDVDCINCYIKGKCNVLDLMENSIAQCPECGIKYNLNNYGKTMNESGMSLCRYRVYYGDNRLIINN